MLSRKNFLKLSVGAAATFSLNRGWTNVFMDGNDAAAKIKKFGIQIWSVRDDMAKDAKGTLKLLADYGYTQIESFVGPQGLWWGMTPTAFKHYINDLGMKCHSVHSMNEPNFEKTVEDCLTAGVEYIVYPWEGPAKTKDDYKRLADDFNKKGEVCKKNGLKFAFHNHDYTFKLMDGEYMQDVLMQNTDPGLVDYQLDLYWVATAGHDPVEWIKKYPNRFRLCHIKDREKDAADTNASCVLGTGKLDFKKILKVAKRYGMKYYYVEQEKWAQGTPLECAKMNAQYMKKIRI
jgi:sugar phosphate isomerase/epimerase